MKNGKAAWGWLHIGLIILLAFCAHAASAQNLQLVSMAGGPVSASANGDSGNPVVSADGRYVLFSSSANNLVLTNSAGPVPSLKPQWQNVFLRDRFGGSNSLVSAGPSGDGGNYHSWPVGMSTNDQYALFESSASNLVPGDTNNADDVFVRDVVNGITLLVSVNTNGVSGSGVSRHSAMTPDGRLVAFVSAAADLVPNDTNGIPDVFVRDLQAGTTTLVSGGATATGSTSLPSTSEWPAITPDGRYVAFYSTATNLVPGVQTAGEVYVRDLVNGTTTWASTNARNRFQAIYGTTNAVSCSPAISEDGRWITFLAGNGVSSYSSYQGVILRYDVVSGNSTVICSNAYVPTSALFADIKTFDESPDGRFVAFLANNPALPEHTIIYLQDTLAGTNILVSANQTTGLAVSGYFGAPVVDPTGRFVTYYCDLATNLVSTPLLNGTGWHLYMRDTQLGSAQLIDVDTNGFGAGIGATFSVSADAGVVAFEILTNSFVTNDNNGDYDVVARDLTMGTTELVSASHPLAPSLTPDRYCKLYASCMSTNARYIAFASDADNLVTNDFNACSDVFVRDTLLGTNILASVGLNGNAAAGVSAEPSISGNGRFVAYSSFATNIVSGDTNQAEDVFVYDLQNATNMLVSAAPSGGMGNNHSYSPQISSDGSFVLFHSQAQNLAVGPFVPGVDNLFLRNLQLQTNYALTTGSVVNAAMTSDGHYVAYVGVASGSSLTNLYVWDSLAAQWIYTNAIGSLTNVAISSDGRWVAYVSGAALYAFDLLGQTNYLIAGGSFDFRAGLQFSADDRLLVFATKSSLVAADTNGTYDIYLHDFQIQTNILVSHSFYTTNAANNASDSPGLSPDGRFVAYRSWASDIAPNDPNNATDLFVYDRVTGTTILVTVDQADNATANDSSRMPVFSGDSKSLVFESYASNLPGPGFNEYNAIYDLNLFPAATVGSGGGQTNAFPFLANIGVNGISGPTSGSPPVITWPCSPGYFYEVQFKNNLTDRDWLDLSGNIIQAGALGQAIDLGVSGQSQRFYRIVLSN